MLVTAELPRPGRSRPPTQHETEVTLQTGVNAFLNGYNDDKRVDRSRPPRVGISVSRAPRRAGRPLTRPAELPRRQRLCDHGQRRFSNAHFVLLIDHLASLVRAVRDCAGR